MADIAIKDNRQAVAAEAARITAEVLTKAISGRGQADWLLSGGTAPMEAYRLLASDYADKVDWSNVVVAIGDERCVPLDDPDANWLPISQTLLEVVAVPENQQLRPKSDLKPEKAAADYEQALQRLAASDGVPHFDLVWLGMGEDGHTLSLFPGDPSIANYGSLVVPIHDAPKPPPDRISLTLRALGNSTNCLIMALGANKADVIARAISGDTSLPINQAIQAIEAAGGNVTWLLDEAAASQLAS